MEEQKLEVRENPHPYGEQDAWGNSIASLRRNLKLTPVERLMHADAAAKSLYRLKNELKPTS